MDPDAWEHDLAHLARPGVDDAQLALFGDYHTNRTLYPALHEWLRSTQVPVLADGTISFTAEHRDLEERLRSTFSGVAMMWVGVHCNPDVAAFREVERPDRVEGMARHQALAAHTGVAYDFGVDTTNRSTETCARDLANLLRSGSLP